METTLVQITDLEARDAGDGTHELVGLCVPYDTPTHKVSGRPEIFRRGAFAGAVASLPGGARIGLKDYNHARDRIAVGKAVHLEEREDGLHGRFRFNRTPEGEAAYANVLEDTYAGLSIGFVARSDRPTSDGYREILAAHLHHVSLVEEPAYDDAKILAVRGAAAADQWRDTFAPLDVTVPDADDTPLTVTVRRALGMSRTRT